MRYCRWIPFLSLLVVAGCGSSGPFEFVPVSGTVAYEDGAPLPGGCKLFFVAQDVEAVGTAHPRPARANVDQQGEFDCVTSYKYGDGLIPGKHKVAIRAGSSADGKPLVPPEYASTETTPLVIDTADAPLLIKVPKP